MSDAAALLAHGPPDDKFVTSCNSVVTFLHLLCLRAEVQPRLWILLAVILYVTRTLPTYMRKPLACSSTASLEAQVST